MGKSDGKGPEEDEDEDEDNEDDKDDDDEVEEDDEDEDDEDDLPLTDDNDEVEDETIVLTLPCPPAKLDPDTTPYLLFLHTTQLLRVFAIVILPGHLVHTHVVLPFKLERYAALATLVAGTTGRGGKALARLDCAFSRTLDVAPKKISRSAILILRHTLPW